MSRLADHRPPGVAGVIHEIRAEIGRCRLCLGLNPWRKQAPESFGTTSTGYMIVSEAPGKLPLPFLRAALSAVGDARYREVDELFYLADAVRCRPQDRGDASKSRLPTRAECVNCHPFLAMEMRALRPRLILAFGPVAAAAVLGRPARLEEEHGRRQRAGEFEVIPLLAPSARSPALRRRGITLESYRTWLTGLFGALIDGLIG